MDTTVAARRRRGTLWLCATLMLFAGAALVAHGPIPQDPDYHLFADERALLGIPNFWNVVSNLPFVLAGLLGLAALARGGTTGVLPELRPAFVLLFGGSVLVGLGSAWYHLAPSNATLVWDRLPMTLAFMGFFTIVLGEHVSVRLAQRALWPLVALGVASVAWWAATDDLRPYALVQFGPVLVLPALLLVHPSRFESTRPLWLVLASYVAAKLLEHWDAAIYAFVGISGHPLKHVVASLAIFAMLAALQRRERTAA